MADSQTLEERVAALEEQLATLIAGGPRRVYMVDVVRFQLPKVLPELQRRHPHGVTTQHVMDHFGFPKATVQSALKTLSNCGKIIRHKRPREHETILLLPGQQPPEVRGMTPVQRRMLNDLIAISDNGRLEMSNQQISRHLGKAPGTVHYMLTCLIMDKRLIVTRRGKGFRPSAYFIPSAIN